MSIVLAGVELGDVTVVAGEGGARPEGCVNQGLSAAQWPVPTYREAGMGPKLLEKKP